MAKTRESGALFLVSSALEDCSRHFLALLGGDLPPPSLHCCCCCPRASTSYLQNVLTNHWFLPTLSCMYNHHQPVLLWCNTCKLTPGDGLPNWNFEQHRTIGFFLNSPRLSTIHQTPHDVLISRKYYILVCILMACMQYICLAISQLAVTEWTFANQYIILQYSAKKYVRN